MALEYVKVLRILGMKLTGRRYLINQRITNMLAHLAHKTQKYGGPPLAACHSKGIVPCAPGYQEEVFVRQSRRCKRCEHIMFTRTLIRLAQKRTGLSLKELAKECGIGYRCFRYYITGDRTPSRSVVLHLERMGKR